MKINPPKHEHWSAQLVRIGNQAVREAQTRNRQLGLCTATCIEISVFYACRRAPV
jgi:hypothetical protein